MDHKEAELVKNSTRRTCGYQPAFMELEHGFAAQWNKCKGALKSDCELYEDEVSPGGVSKLTRFATDAQAPFTAIPSDNTISYQIQQKI